MLIRVKDSQPKFTLGTVGQVEARHHDPAVVREFQARNQERLESNSEYQRLKTMTKEEKVRRAKDQMQKNIHDYRNRCGNDVTAKEAEAAVEHINDRYVREIEQR